MKSFVTLCLSFWNIGLSNFSLGRFIHSRLTPEKASDMVRDAQSAKRLLCVSDEDLFAPYRKRELRHHEEMCKLLNRQFNLSIRIDDFATQDEECCTIRPLSLFQIDHDLKIMVINCAYTAGDKQVIGDIGPNFQIAPDTIEFHLFRACPNISK